MSAKNRPVLERMKGIYERFSKVISCGLIVAIICSWVFTIFFPNIVSFNTALAFTTSVSTGFILLMLDYILWFKDKSKNDISIFENENEFTLKVNELFSLEVP